MKKVRCLLDIDGVLNAVCINPPHSVWDVWRSDRCNGFMIHFAVKVAEYIASLEARGVEIVWVTTWAELANKHISPFLGLGTYRVGGDPDDDYPGSSWWKLYIAKREYETDNTPFVWIDDDLNYAQEAQDWLETLDPTHYAAVCPSTYKGITPQHIEQIEEFLAYHGL